MTYYFISPLAYGCRKAFRTTQDVFSFSRNFELTPSKNKNAVSATNCEGSVYRARVYATTNTEAVKECLAHFPHLQTVLFMRGTQPTPPKYLGHMGIYKQATSIHWHLPARCSSRYILYIQLFHTLCKSCTSRAGFLDSSQTLHKPCLGEEAAKTTRMVAWKFPTLPTRWQHVLKHIWENPPLLSIVVALKRDLLKASSTKKPAATGIRFHN